MTLCECGHFATDHRMRTLDPRGERGACFAASCRCKGFITPAERRERTEAIADRLLREHGETLRKLADDD